LKKYRFGLEGSVSSRCRSAPTIIAGLRRREPTIDFRTADDVGLAGLNDATVLAIAADEGRLLVSHDVSTMPQRLLVVSQSFHLKYLSLSSAFLPLVFLFVLFISFRRTLEKKKGGKFRDGKQ
jgi:hypothetical protein